jgi:hypothetical protein
MCFITFSRINKRSRIEMPIMMLDELANWTFTHDYDLKAAFRSQKGETMR